MDSTGGIDWNVKMDMDHSNHTDHMDHMDMMMMYFHTMIGNDTILFKSWKPKTNGEVVYLCVIIIIVTMLYEAIKYGREYLHIRQRKKENFGSGYANQLVDFLHLTQTFLHLVQYTLSYALMLVAMTYQVYFYFAIVLGAGLGYLLLNPIFSKLKAGYRNFDDVCC